MPERFDSIIIGAGAAGLACARDLSGAGQQVCILEARDRVGGRIFTIHTPDLPLPLELGAEFVHGEADDTFSIVEAAALAAYQLPDTHWWSRNGRWSLVEDFWSEVDRVRAKIPRGKDTSFADFMKTQRRIQPRLREMMMSFVENYHAAHADRISALALRTADGEQDDPGGNKQFRIANGYDALIEWLRAGLDPSRVTLRLGTAATEIAWSKGDVRVTTSRGDELRASACVITVPLGVLKAADGIRFTPELKTKKRALEKLEVGHVVKIIFRFRERFWDERERGTPINFIHSSDRFVPTWWTAAPMRAPILTAWAGGHAADRMLTDGAPQERALDSLAKTFAMPRREIDKLVESAHTHDWQADAFSRGAYSYAAVGGKNAHAALAKPLDETLFFAGEATSGDQTGTVAGAIESGRKAAAQVQR